MGDDVVDLYRGNESLKIKTGFYDEKCLQESKAKLIKQINDEKKAK